MGPGPVFDAELLTQARRRRMYVTRLVYGLLLFWILLESYIIFIPSAWTGRAASATQVQIFAGSTFLNIEILQAIAVLAMTPVLVAGTIAGERQRKTLHYLIASRLTSAEIVVGKLLARLLALGVVLAVGLPVLSLLTLLGGVDPRLVALGLAADVSMAVFLGGLAILVSSYVARAADAIVRTYALGLAWLFLPPIITFVLSSFWWYEWIRPAYIWIDASNPILLLYDFGRGPDVWVERLAWMIGIQLAAGTAFILVAVWRLRPSFRRGEGRRAVTSVLGRHGWRWRVFARPAMADDPVRWKEFHTSRTGGAAKLAAVVLGLAIAGLVGYAAWYLAVPAFRELREYGYGAEDNTYGARGSFGTFVAVLGAFFVTTLLLGIATSAAGRVTGEREEDTWTSLVATPLDGREILLPKLLGAIRSVRWGVLMPLALWLVGLAAGSVYPLAVPVLAVELAVYARVGAP